MIRLYQMIESPYCHRVRIVLAEKQLDYQSVIVDLSKKENKTEQFLRLNPLSKVPVLADEDLILAESLIINEYLNEEYPFPELMPEDPQQKAQARLWASQVDNMVTASFGNLAQIFWAKNRGEGVDETKREASIKKIHQFLEIAEKNLRNRDYLVGTYGLADIAFAPWVSRFEKYEVEIPSQYSHVKNWIKKLVTRNSFISTKDK